MTQYRVIAENPDILEPISGDELVWEGEADDRTDAVMQSGFEEERVIEVEEIDKDPVSPIAQDLQKLESHEVVDEGHNPDFKQPGDEEKTEFTAEELDRIERRARAQHEADKHFADKRVIAIATSLLGLHYDTAIEPARMLKHHTDEAIRKVREAVEAEGMEMVEDIMIKIRVSVMVQPKGSLPPKDAGDHIDESGGAPG